MFLNIITPCSRWENLQRISESINIPQDHYRWIVVYDGTQLPDAPVPHNCEMYYHKDSRSVVGHAQRNHALTLVQCGHVYFNDDDTMLHPQLWNRIQHLDHYDFISFSQNFKNNKLRLRGDVVKLNHIDSHNFIASKLCIKECTFDVHRYSADGIFAEQCYAQAKNTVFIDEVLSIYNWLR
jgi:hypothetical protein